VAGKLYVEAINCAQLLKP